jgi:hypothetical protein
MEDIRQALEPPTIDDLIDNRDYRYNVERIIYDGELPEEQLFEIVERSGKEEYTTALVYHLEKENKLRGNNIDKLLKIILEDDAQKAFEVLVDEFHELVRTAIVLAAFENAVRRQIYPWKCLNALIYIGLSEDEDIELYRIFSRSTEDNSNLKLCKFILSGI